MTSYRFRVKFEYDPTELWRDVVVGAERTIDEFQSVLNDSVGLDQAHLWFFGPDEDYWESDVLYRRPGEIERSVAAPRRDDEEYDAGETTIRQMAGHLELAEGDRICYLFDYGDEWRFYGILKEIDEGSSDEKSPEVVAEKGDPVQQYAPPEDRL